METCHLFGSLATQCSLRTRNFRPLRSRCSRLEVMQLDERVTPTVTAMAGFTGVNNTGWTPPDSNIAVGPSYVIETVNESMAIYNKSTGALLSSQALTSLFSGLVAG